eukprot:8984009-Pyramimonas_sp.AAC.1
MNRNPMHILRAMAGRCSTRVARIAMGVPRPGMAAHCAVPTASCTAGNMRDWKHAWHPFPICEATRMEREAEAANGLPLPWGMWGRSPPSIESVH